MIHNNDKNILKVGPFSIWLNGFIDSLRGGKDVDVPCGDCTACCTSSYFVHIKPIDRETLQHVPKEIIFPAPGLPEGHYLLGYDENGLCPMFQEGKCSIYDYRPLTCRQYDCRVFPATGLTLGKEEKPLISSQAKRWKFDTSSKNDSDTFKAVRISANFIKKYKERFPDASVPLNTPQQAIMAIRVYDIFLGLSKEDLREQAEEIINLIVSRCGQNTI